MKKSNASLLPILLILACIICAFIPQTQAPKPKNLKILPKDISHEALHEVMEGFNKALGVKCNFCHAPSPTDPKKLDFASDEKHHKEVARMMMTMTQKTNKKYFKGEDKNGNPRAITCITCHNGNPHPAKK